jgi:hypothetical protein
VAQSFPLIRTGRVTMIFDRRLKTPKLGVRIMTRFLNRYRLAPWVGPRMVRSRLRPWLLHCCPPLCCWNDEIFTYDSRAGRENDITRSRRKGTRRLSNLRRRSSQNYEPPSSNGTQFCGRRARRLAVAEGSNSSAMSTSHGILLENAHRTTIRVQYQQHANSMPAPPFLCYPVRLTLDIKTCPATATT